MPDYSKGKIYMIVSDSGCYVGSTTQTLRRRYRKHITDKRKVSSHKIIENSKIILLQDYPCKTRNELLWKEREWIEKTDCVNKDKPLITKEEHKEYQKNYRINNRDNFNSYRKEWRNYKKSWGFNGWLGTSLNLLDVDPSLFE